MDIAAVIVSIVALLVTVVFSIRSDRRAATAEKQTAESATEAEMAAEESRRISQRHADAATETARQQALTNEAMQAMVAEMRQARGSRSQNLTTETQPAGPTLRIERSRGQTYVLRNVGSAEATGVTLTTDHPEALTRTLPQGETLAPGQGHSFLLAGSMQARLPTEVCVSWSGQPQPIHLALPQA